MKTLAKVGSVIALSGSLFFSACAGSYYVADQPVEPVYERPVAPYAGAVWIEGDWNYTGGHYAYRRGYWSRPVANRTYYRGSWVHTNRGYAWRRGGWRK